MAIAIAEKKVDKTLGKSSAFKSVTRHELDRLRGPRPKYEENFQNDFNRYNVKYMDPKIKGIAKFESPVSVPMKAPDKSYCHRGLTKMAQITLNIRKTKDVQKNDSAGKNL